MKDAILLELAARWEREAKAPEIEDGSEQAKVPNAIARGERQGMRMCADALRMLVQMLGDTTTGPMYPRCTKRLQAQGVAYPRTCAECGLGPCKAADKDAV